MSATVSVLSCDSYDYDKVRAALEESLKNLGGIARYVKPGERVLLKVNLLMKKRPEEATTTHPSLVRAMADILTERGAKVIIGDSPGGPFTPAILKGQYQVTGFEEAARLSGAELNFNCKTALRQNPEGKLLKTIKVADMINDVDKIISMAKFKVHGMMTFTGATKNMFGVIPGLAKAEYHINMPDYADFADALVDICLCAKPVLSIMDAVEAMEGNGPSGGEVYRMNMIMASASPFHLDKTACATIGLKCADVPVLKAALNRGIIEEGPADVNLRGEPLKGFYAPQFKKVKNAERFSISNLPPIARKFAERHIRTRPTVKKDLCKGCGECARSCPAKVIRIEDKTAVISRERCIRCYCCQELCPFKAVEIKKPVLARVMSLFT